MSKRAEPDSRGGRSPGRRPQFDRAWIGRIALALIVAAALALVARVSTMVFGGGSARIERFERSVDRDQAREPPMRAAPAR
jgi:hypothetical protein